MKSKRNSPTILNGYARRRGYTLVEVAIVIAMVGIAAAAAVPRFQSNVATQLDSFAQIVVADLQRARELAVVNNSSYRVTFERDENRFYLEHSGANAALNTLPPTIFKNVADTATRQYTDLDELPQLGAGAALQTVLVQSASPTATSTLEFGPLGSTVQAAETTVWLTSGDGDGRLYIGIRINPVTGLAQVDPITATAPATGNGAGS